MPPRCLQDTSKIGPRAPRSPQDASKALQEHPRRLRAPSKAPPKALQRGLWSSQEASKSSPEEPPKPPAAVLQACCWPRREAQSVNNFSWTGHEPFKNTFVRLLGPPRAFKEATILQLAMLMMRFCMNPLGLLVRKTLATKIAETELKTRLGPAKSPSRPFFFGPKAAQAAQERSKRPPRPRRETSGRPTRSKTSRGRHLAPVLAPFWTLDVQIPSRRPSDSCPQVGESSSIAKRRCCKEALGRPLARMCQLDDRSRSS